jgi:hypothetical protein
VLHAICAQEGVGCSGSFLHALNYSQVAGLCAGMIVLGLLVDRIGRKWGSVSTAGIMLAGARTWPLLPACRRPTCHSAAYVPQELPQPLCMPCQACSVDYSEVAALDAVNGQYCVVSGGQVSS